MLQISHMEDALKSREEGWKEEHMSHEDQLNKLSTLTKEREMSWQKQKQEMEEHYQQLISEMQARIKVCDFGPIYKCLTLLKW